MLCLACSMLFCCSLCIVVRRLLSIGRGSTLFVCRLLLLVASVCPCCLSIVVRGLLCVVCGCMLIVVVRRVLFVDCCMMLVGAVSCLFRFVVGC